MKRASAARALRPQACVNIARAQAIEQILRLARELKQQVWQLKTNEKWRVAKATNVSNSISPITICQAQIKLSETTMRDKSHRR